jgi:hypothetical protein
MLTGGTGAVFTSVSVVSSGLWFLVIALEEWLVLSVLAQFAGGEEERAPNGRRRGSMLLVMVASVPLALRKLVEGIVMSLKDPAIAANALTLSDYRAFSKVRLDLYGLLRLPDLPAFPGYLVRRATDPFSLWCLCVLVVGGVAVYRMPIRKTLFQSGLLLVVLAAQTALFAAIGIPWEM